jgi:hypothetical protein
VIVLPALAATGNGQSEEIQVDTTTIPVSSISNKE